MSQSFQINRKWGLLIALTLSAILMSSVFVLTVQARPQGNTYFVTRTDDPAGSGTIGNLSLRQAVAYANADPGSTIQLTRNTVYVLSNTGLGELLVTADMTFTHDFSFSCLIIACPATIEGQPGVWNSGILYVGGGAHVALENLVLRYGKTDVGGGIYNGGYLTLDSSTLYSNTATTLGGSGYGGGLANHGTAILNASDLTYNSADYGGGLYNYTGAVATGDSSRFLNNVAGYAGGAIDSYGAITLTNSELDSNQTPYGWFGGLANERDASAWLLNTSVTNNAANGGGGLYNAGALTLIGDTIQFNTASTADGGGLYTALGNLRPSSVVMTDTFVGDNYADNGKGGGIYNVAGSIQMYHSILVGDWANYGGGLFQASSLPVKLLNSSLLNNLSFTSGGGLYSSANTGSVYLYNDTVQDNQSNTGSGGGLYLEYLSGNTYISNTTINGNQATSTAAYQGGGGLYTNSGLFIYNSTFSGNISQHDGGGIKNNNGQVYLNNTTFSGNSAHRDGGAIHTSGGYLDLFNVTIADNTVLNSGGGISNSLTTLNSYDSLLGNNVATFGPNCGGDFNSMGYNLIADTAGCTYTGGAGDLTGVNPLLDVLKNNGGPTLTYALLPGSPAFNAGNPSGCIGTYGVMLTTDQRGFPRTLGPRCDIGAVEMGALVYLPTILR